MVTQKIILITAPSGAGKTSISRYLLQQFPQLAFSISATTRPPRGAEKHGVDYYFLSPEAFQQKIAEDAFLEYEMVYEGRYYGTLKSEVNRMWQAQQVPVLDVDVQGARRVMELYPGACCSLFIMPPSLEVLRQRLTDRGTETPESLEMRLGKAAYEMSFAHLFHHTILNQSLPEAQAAAAAAVQAFLAA